MVQESKLWHGLTTLPLPFPTCFSRTGVSSVHGSDTDAVTNTEAPPVRENRVGKGGSAFLPHRSCTRERLVPLLLILLASSLQCYF